MKFLLLGAWPVAGGSVLVPAGTEIDGNDPQWRGIVKVRMAFVMINKIVVPTAFPSVTPYKDGSGNFDSAFANTTASLRRISIVKGAATGKRYFVDSFLQAFLPSSDIARTSVVAESTTKSNRRFLAILSRCRLIT